LDFLTGRIQRPRDWGCRLLFFTGKTRTKIKRAVNDLILNIAKDLALKLKSLLNIPKLLFRYP
jgi:hypothetical protein